MIWLYLWWAGSTGPFVTPTSDVTADYVVQMPSDDVVVRVL